MNSQTRPPWPEFFLVGAPKSATGAIDTLLASHPDVHMAPKDLHFFASDLRSTQPRQSEEEYLAQFVPAPHAALRGEASVGYLVSAQAAQAIRDRRPEALIVMSLRNPLTAIPSLHRHCLYYGIEEIEDLGEALAAEPERAAGRRLPARSAHAWMLRYMHVYRYREQVERYFELFGRARCHVMIYEEFAADPAPAMRSLTEFLGLTALEEIGAERVNPTRQARSRRVSALLTDPPPVARRLVRAATPQWLRRRVADGLLALNTAAAEPAPNGGAVRARLASEFAEEVSRLEELLGRDLPWMPR